MSNKHYYFRFSSLVFSLLLANAGVAHSQSHFVPENQKRLLTNSNGLQLADIPEPSTNIATGTRLVRPMNQILQDGVNFKPSSNPQPKNTSPAGTRGGVCDQDIYSESSSALSMIPLVPEVKSGYTIAERPTLLLYVPQTSAQQIILIISENNEQGEKLHSQTFFSIHH